MNIYIFPCIVLKICFAFFSFMESFYWKFYQVNKLSFEMSMSILTNRKNTLENWTSFVFLLWRQNGRDNFSVTKEDRRRTVCCQRPREGGLGMPDLESHWLAERLAYLGRSLTKETVWGHKVRDVFPRLRSNPKAESRSRLRGEIRFSIECCRALCNLPRSSDLSWPRKKLYHGLVEGSVSDPLEKLLGLSLGEIHSQWNWAPGSSFWNNSEFSLTWRLARNALALRDWAYRACLTDLSDCPRCSSAEETALHAFYYCGWVRPFWSHVEEWMARISPKQLVLLYVGYVIDNVVPPYKGAKRVVFLAIMAVARMVIWVTRNKGLYEGANFSHRDLILYFRHQLRVKIRWDRKP